ncbi:hypothetical protein EQV77_10475 [Halobacillus fulvus]|nr:hypothetical protein EQV77_10475 [Halobacillus fulvus]
MKKIVVFAAFLLLFLAGCSSASLGLEDLKEEYPDSFGEPIDTFSAEEQEKIGLPHELPFVVDSVEASTGDNQVTVRYVPSSDAQELTVTTIFSPENILRETELQVPLNNGAVAGVEDEGEQAFVEWYNSDLDVVYQVEFVNNEPSEEQTPAQQAVDIANAT